ncbi:MAG: hypothetical protein J5892_04015 [Bacilli bacterium]|nr:hypothetical protein [Bacilli bacterium]
MEDFLYYNDLFDIYGDLLTDNEKENFLEYYQEDLSLSEIASNKNVSRNAIHKTLKVVIDKLNNYEAKLHVYEMKQALNEAIELENISEIKNKLKTIIDK